MNNNNKAEYIKYIRIIKFMIKHNIPAKPKFFALLLIKELLETKNTDLVSNFAKKCMDRF